MREPFLRERVWTVMFSGASFRTSVRVFENPSGVSAGRPAMRSMLT